MRLTERATEGAHSAAERRLVETILSARRGISATATLVDDARALLGPLACLPYAPDVGDPVQQVGAALRDSPTLAPSATEAAILTVARAHHAAFEWYAHERIARTSAALDDDDIRRLSTGATPTDGTAALAHRLTRSLVDSGTLEDDEFTEGVAAFGERGIVELVILVGYYRLLALLETTFQTPMPTAAPAPPWRSSATPGPAEEPAWPAGGSSDTKEP